MSLHNESDSKLFDVLDQSQSPTLTSRQITKKRKRVSCVGWAVEHFPYHLTLLKLAVHHTFGLIRHCKTVPTQPKKRCTSIGKVRFRSFIVLRPNLQRELVLLFK